jgi:hypothetical protein
MTINLRISSGSQFSALPMNVLVTWKKYSRGFIDVRLVCCAETVDSKKHKEDVADDQYDVPRLQLKPVHDRDTLEGTFQSLARENWTGNKETRTL